MPKYTAAEFVRVTPTQARKWLENNPRNRDLREPYVLKLADDMRSGRWVVNGETVKIDTAGALVDGQHRLSAIIAANTPQTMLVATGLSTDPSVQYTTDMGQKRSLANSLTMQGEKNANVLGSAINVLWRYVNRISQTTHTPTVGQALELLEEHPGLRDAVSVQSHLKSSYPYRPSALTWGVYTMDTISKNDDAMDDDIGSSFWEHVCGGLDYTATDPVFHLRNRMDQERRQPVRATPAWVMAMTIKAWNAYAVGADVSNLRWRRRGPAPETFPRMYGEPVLEDLGWFVTPGE